VVFAVDDPDTVGEQLTASCTYPIVKNYCDITLQVTDEEGYPFGTALWSQFFHKMDGRQLQAFWPGI